MSNAKPWHTTGRSSRGALLSSGVGSGRIACQQNRLPRKQKGSKCFANPGNWLKLDNKLRSNTLLFGVLDGAAMTIVALLKAITTGLCKSSWNTWWACAPEAIWILLQAVCVFWCVFWCAQTPSSAFIPPTNKKICILASLAPNTSALAFRILVLLFMCSTCV